MNNIKKVIIIFFFVAVFAGILQSSHDTEILVKCLFVSVYASLIVLIIKLNRNDNDN